MDKHTFQLYAAAKLVTDFIKVTDVQTPDGQYQYTRTEFPFHGTLYVAEELNGYPEPFLDKMTILKQFVDRFELENPEVFEMRP